MTISENKKIDRKSHKLDDDGGGVDGGVRSIGIVLISYYLLIIIICLLLPNIQSKDLRYEPTILFGRVLQGRTKSQPGSTNIFHFTAYISSYCLGRDNWIIYCGSKKITVVPSSFHATCVIRIENILMEIRNCVVNA
ncbi:unnamed protein product [Rhizophagus irregularis]|uniref:Uncharacterized protein n=1 Tax=Rhizophagus irregularis TaxID=588596 RepID=A0A916E4C0_9GLOM|nr:unnamed protein product [Rhizophagus irregularis]